MKRGEVRMETTYQPDYNGVYLLLRPTVNRGARCWFVLVLSDATWPAGMTMDLSREWLLKNTQKFA